MKKISWEKAIEKKFNKKNNGTNGVILMNQLGICIGICKILTNHYSLVLII